MLNRSASLAMSTSVLNALPGKLDIKRHSPSILYVLYRSLLHSKLQFLADQAGLGVTWSRNPKTDFLVTSPIKGTDMSKLCFNITAHYAAERCGSVVQCQT